jgi:hypothetical protein
MRNRLAVQVVLNAVEADIAVLMTGTIAIRER